MQCGSEADKKHICGIAMKKFPIFALDSPVSTARDRVFMSNTTVPRIFVDVLRVLVLMIDRLAHSMDILGFFRIVCQTGFDPRQGYVTFHSWQEVDWS